MLENILQVKEIRYKTYLQKRGLACGLVENCPGMSRLHGNPHAGLRLWPPRELSNAAARSGRHASARQLSVGALRAGEEGCCCSANAQTGMGRDQSLRPKVPGLPWKRAGNILGSVGRVSCLSTQDVGWRDAALTLSLETWQLQAGLFYFRGRSLWDLWDLLRFTPAVHAAGPRDMSLGLGGLRGTDLPLLRLLFKTLEKSSPSSPPTSFFIWYQLSCCLLLVHFPLQWFALTAPFSSPPTPTVNLTMGLPWPESC